MGAKFTLGFTQIAVPIFVPNPTSKSVIIWGVRIANVREEECGKPHKQDELIATGSSRGEDEAHGC